MVPINSAMRCWAHRDVLLAVLRLHSPRFGRLRAPFSQQDPDASRCKLPQKNAQLNVPNRMQGLRAIDSEISGEPPPATYFAIISRQHMPFLMRDPRVLVLSKGWQVSRRRLVHPITSKVARRNLSRRRAPNTWKQGKLLKCT